MKNFKELVRNFNHETITVDNIIAAKKTLKQHQNDGKAIRNIQTIIEDTKIAIDNIQDVLSNNALIQQVWLRIINVDTSFGDEILGTKEQGNNGSRYRPYLALDGKNIIEIRIADHYETKKTCLDKSNNKVQYLFQVVLITEPPKPESDASIKTNQSVGNVKVLTNDIVSQDTELDAVVTLFQKISNFLQAPSETYNEIVNNNQLNCNKYMNKKNRIRLTESQLHSAIKKSVKRVLREMSQDDPQSSEFDDIWDKDTISEFAYEYLGAENITNDTFVDTDYGDIRYKFTVKVLRIFLPSFKEVDRLARDLTNQVGDIYRCSTCQNYPTDLGYYLDVRFA